MNTLRRHRVILAFGLLFASCDSPPVHHASLPVAAGQETARSLFAGTWQVSAWDASGNPLPGHTITATADTMGWSQSFPDRSDIPVRVLAASGELVVFEAGPYESVLRPEVSVTALFVTRIDGDRTSGHLIAWYDDPNRLVPVLKGRTEGARH
jgi:hypothetical protein